MAGHNIVIVACEQSGDNYGALLARELRALAPDARLSGLGGPAMKQAGVELLENMIERSATGFVEVLASARFFLRTMKRIVEHATAVRAEAVVMIDSPDFNLRIAPRIQAAGIPTVYYVSPQLWAWRSGRVKTVRRHIDTMLVIFPFEVEWYRRHGADATFVGHPMLDLFDIDAIREAGAGLRSELCAPGERLVGLLPGSRRNEIIRLLPDFLEAAALMKRSQRGLRFAIGCSRWLTPERVEAMCAGHEELGLAFLHGRAHELMAASDVILACSGTATLETALIGTPLIMAYKLNFFSRLIAELLVDRDQLFCMPNRILGEEIAPELLPGKVNPAAIAREGMRLLGPDAGSVREAWRKLESVLGGPGASRRAAQAILDTAKRG